jgi:hypothetical protein
MGALREDGESPAHANDAAHPANAAKTGGKGGGEGERPVQARLSNFHHYAVTGVKAQAFVRYLFYDDALHQKLY